MRTGKIYSPPEGVHGPTLGRDLPQDCDYLPAVGDPRDERHAEMWMPCCELVMATSLYWWRSPSTMWNQAQANGESQ
ncbi:MAG: hypothetical protein KA758_06935 [Acidimicrobiales bacterium]|nr:hypothetical protein [Acidimicrobiales bacterium]